jgi:uncharacterized SAM-binding protein YcdF (DUF218 family)
VTPAKGLLLAAAAAAFAWLALAVALFVFTTPDAPGRSDAVVVLAGSKHRLPVGLDLVHGNAAPLLVVSRDPDGRDRAADRLCRRGVTGEDVPVVCFVADPYSTRGEARAVDRLAGERGWDSIAVVTSRFHLHRAELLLERCFHGDLRMVSAPVDWWRWPRALVGETAKLGHALLAARSC